MKTIGLIGGMSWESTVEELCVGTVRLDSKAQLAMIMSRLVETGAEGIILGCTELDLLVQSEDCRVPLLDTTREHALAAVELALKPQASN